MNLPGSYSCVCSVGYRLNAVDFKTCDGIVFKFKLVLEY